MILKKKHVWWTKSCTTSEERILLINWCKISQSSRSAGFAYSGHWGWWYFGTTMGFLVSDVDKHESTLNCFPISWYPEEKSGIVHDFMTSIKGYWNVYDISWSSDRLEVMPCAPKSHTVSVSCLVSFAERCQMMAIRPCTRCFCGSAQHHFYNALEPFLGFQADWVINWETLGFYTKTLGNN